MGRTAFEVRGLAELQRSLDNILRKVSVRVETATREQALEIQHDAEENFIPIKYAVLLGSGRIEKITRGGKTAGWRIIFGGVGIPETIPTHEYPSPADPPSWQKSKHGVTFHPSGRGPKWLERPTLKKANTLARDLADAMQEALRP